MVTGKDIVKIAKLAKLRVKDEETERLARDMSEIICFADTINNAVEDSEEEFDGIAGIVNAFHEDITVESFNRDDILKNREGGENGMFVIKKHLS